jgi:hypothetical protein
MDDDEMDIEAVGDTLMELSGEPDFQAYVSANHGHYETQSDCETHAVHELTDIVMDYGHSKPEKVLNTARRLLRVWARQDTPTN